MSSQAITVAILGAGGIAQRHAAAWRNSPDAEIAAFVDLVPDKAQEAAERFGGIAVTSLDELRAERAVDLIDVCTKEWHHAATAVPALAYAPAVLVEKIMAHELDAGLAMVRAARAHGGFAAVQYNYRFIPGIARILELARSRAYGALQHVAVRCVHNCFNHLLDTGLALIGEPLSVVAEGSTRPAEQQCQVAEDIVYFPGPDFTALVRGDSGALLSISCVSTHHEDLPYGITARFAEGTVELSDCRWPADVLGRLRLLPDTELLDRADYPDGDTQTISFDPALAEVARRVRAGAAPVSDWEQGWNVMLVSHACYRAIAAGRRIDMAELRAEVEAREAVTA